MGKRLLAICFVIFGFSGCAAYSVVEPGQPMPIGADLTVEPQVAWASVAYPGTTGKVWTIDGVGLNTLHFFMDVESGEPVVRLLAQSNDDMPSYDQSMLAPDVMDLIATTMTKLGAQQVETDNLRPSQFGPNSGYKFDLKYTVASGLIMNGIALAAQREDRLDTMIFVAPEEYYFGEYVPLVERVFASIRAE